MSTGVRPWVFCASMADVFDNEVPTEWRNMLWELVRETPLLRWIFVTKRIGNAAKMLPSDWAKNFDHCGLVATIANQAEADRDLPKLLLTPAAWRGVSAEPLLGPINFAWALHQLDWIVVGGESGANARPMHPRWAIDIRDQCERAGVSFHFKQWGEWLPLPMVSFSGAGWQFTRERDGKRYGLVTSGHFEERSPEFSGLPIETQHPWPEDGCHYLAHPTMLRVGKARAGRLLDRDEHNGMPPARG